MYINRLSLIIDETFCEKTQFLLKWSVKWSSSVYEKNNNIWSRVTFHHSHFYTEWSSSIFLQQPCCNVAILSRAKRKIKGIFFIITKYFCRFRMTLKRDKVLFENWLNNLFIGHRCKICYIIRRDILMLIRMW